ncbi:hypothetical protein GCM10025873_18170 [Demequina sediminis]|nr:hypothetical protein GCM10025873_18170 [Demequina sediminis]
MSEEARLRTQRASTITAPVADIVDHSDAALEHRPIGRDPLPSDRQAQVVEVAEGREIGRAEGSVRHVEVFRTVSLGTSILEDLDPYPRPFTIEWPLQPQL